MSLDQLKKDLEELDNFKSLSLPSFGPYYISFISKDLMDPIICFNRNNHDSGKCFQIKIASNVYTISTNYFPNISSNCEMPIKDDINLQDLDLLIPIFIGNEFCVCPSNIQLLSIISRFVNNQDLLNLYEFVNDLFNQIEKMSSLLELQEAIFDFDLNYFFNYKEKDENDITIKIKKFDKNYISRFLYELGCSKPILSQKIAKFAVDICNVIDSNEYPKEQNEKSLRNVISEYFLLQIKSSDKMQNNNYLFREFYDHNLIDKDELLEAIFSIINFTPKNYKSLLWFLDILPPNLKQVMEDLMCEIDMKKYENQISYINNLTSNNFQLFKQAVLKVESVNAYANAIRVDKVDQLQELLTQKRTHDQSIKLNSKLGDLIFEVDEKLNNTTLLNYAAFYGSIKCFKYLLLNGANIEEETFCFAINGQNAEILHIIQQKVPIKSKYLKSAIEVNANDIFDWLYDKLPDKSNINYNKIVCRSIRHYNFDVFLKLFTKANDLAYLKREAINGGNYEILRFLNIISTESSQKTVKIFDIPTYSAIMEPKYRMQKFPSHLKNYQIGNSVELFQIYFKYLETKTNKEKTRDKLNKWFTKAVQDKEYYTVKYLFNQYDFVDFINEHKEGFLRMKVANNNLPSILHLIIQNKRINVNATPSGSRGTAFTLAVWDGIFACARILYNRGDVDINPIGNRGETPLTGCVESNKVSIAKILISFDDVDVNKPNERNETPYQMACSRKNNFDMLTVLLRRKDLIFDIESILEQFQRAFFANRIDLMKAIYSHPNFDAKQLNIDQLFRGQNMDGVDIKTIYALSQMIDNSDSLAFQKLVLRISDPMLYITLLDSDKSYALKSSNLSQKGIFPYYYAIKANKPETIEYLLQYPEIDVNAVHPKKRITPLLQTIQTKEASFDIFKHLFSCERLDIHASQSIVGSEIDFLNLFVENNKIKELSMFIEYKIQNNRKIDDDFFMFLINNNLFDFIKLIIEKGYRSHLLNYALFASIKNGKNSLDLFNFLIDLDNKGEISLDFNFRSANDEYKTPLMESIFLSQKYVFDSLLKISKIDINLENQNGVSAFDYAEEQYVSNGDDHFFNKLIQTQQIDLLKTSYSNRSLSRINFIIESKNNFIFSSILTVFKKPVLTKICDNIDLQLIINNIQYFRSQTLLFFINNIQNRILETVNNDCSFIFEVLKYYIKKDDDQIISFKDTNLLKVFVDMGFDVDSVDKNGETILMHAIRYQKFESCFTILLFDDVKLKIKNKNNEDSAAIARKLGNISVAKTIEKMIQNGHE